MKLFKKEKIKTMVQITKCLCGKIFAACCEPHCYTDADYQKETRAYIKKGCTVEMVESGTWSFEKCTCINMKPIAHIQASLFN